MTEEQAKLTLDQLRTGVESEVIINKEDFLTFRNVLMKAEDVMNFRGKARHNGITIYTFEPGWSK